jgi:hypothetical protein
LTIIIPNESGPKASSRVEKGIFPCRQSADVPFIRRKASLPFLRSSRVTVTAEEDILNEKVRCSKSCTRNENLVVFRTGGSVLEPTVENLEGSICRASPHFPAAYSSLG